MEYTYIIILLCKFVWSQNGGFQWRAESVFCMEQQLRKLKYLLSPAPPFQWQEVTIGGK